MANKDLPPVNTELCFGIIAGSIVYFITQDGNYAIAGACVGCIVGTITDILYHVRTGRYFL